MGLRKPTRVALAKYYLQRCRDDDTTHVHGLEMAIVADVVDFEELDLKPAELQCYLLKEARLLARLCITKGDVEAALALNSMLGCKHWCQGVVTLKSVELDAALLASLLRRQAISVARQCLDDDSELAVARETIRRNCLTAAELGISQDILNRILANDDPPSRP